MLIGPSYESMLRRFIRYAPQLGDVSQRNRIEAKGSGHLGPAYHVTVLATTQQMLNFINFCRFIPQQYYPQLSFRVLFGREMCNNIGWPAEACW
jgi:hypothetical protein